MAYLRNCNYAVTVLILTDSPPCSFFVLPLLLLLLLLLPPLYQSSIHRLHSLPKLRSHGCWLVGNSNWAPIVVSHVLSLCCKCIRVWRHTHVTWHVGRSRSNQWYMSLPLRCLGNYLHDRCIHRAPVFISPYLVRQYSFFPACPLRSKDDYRTFRSQEGRASIALSVGCCSRTQTYITLGWNQKIVS